MELMSSNFESLVVKYNISYTRYCSICFSFLDIDDVVVFDFVWSSTLAISKKMTVKKDCFYVKFNPFECMQPIKVNVVC